ncbi:AraC family transcriptional regulator [Flavobacterium sp.]|uniref:AraC family transcriptional regulator n=1 Tax=Flavobacterium sp. TaxID=239 RepID=UPI003D0CB2E9
MQEEYLKRLNKVFLYIDQNLDETLSLEQIAQVANYSPYHLHRLFKAITNETLHEYIIRKKIEKSAIALLNRKKMTISEIAFQNGFKSDAVFSRTFKKIYQQSPSAFRKNNPHHLSKMSQTLSKIGQENVLPNPYLCHVNQLKEWTRMQAKIEIRTNPEMHFAFVTQLGTEGIPQAFEKIVKWAQPKELLNKEQHYLCRVFHDSFKITDTDKVRMSIGLLTPSLTTVSGEISSTVLAAGKNIVGRFTIVPVEFEKAWNSMFLWMTENGYTKADRNPFEIYLNDSRTHPENKCIVDLYIPII